MKYLLVILVTCCMSPITKAQSCNYYYLQNNKQIEMSMYGKKGDLSGKLVYKISDVKETGGTTSAKVNSEMQDKMVRLLAAALLPCNAPMAY